MIRETEHQAIDAFLDTYNGVCGCDYRVTRRPDDGNRRTEEIDALAECDGCAPLAIEHTTIESHKGQREIWARFTRYIYPLEKRLNGAFPFGFQVIVPDAAFGVGKDWTQVAADIERVFLQVAAEMPEGATTIGVVSAGCDITIIKRESPLQRVYFIRVAPDGDILDLLDDGMQKALSHKHEALGRYRDAGAIGVLLLDSSDVALINEHILRTAAQHALSLRPRPNIDQVWLSWKLGSEFEVFCLTGPDALVSAATEYTYGGMTG